MATLSLQTGDRNPILRTVSKPVERITKNTLRLIRDMTDTMDRENGVGLAAPQVGVHERIIIVAGSPETNEKSPVQSP